MALSRLAAMAGSDSRLGWEKRSWMSGAGREKMVVGIADEAPLTASVVSSSEARISAACHLSILSEKFCLV